MIDLYESPNLLIAGATGQGKSNCLNTVIMSLLYKKHPAQLKFILIDPKRVEFSIYSKLENHFLAKLPGAEKPIITEFPKALYVLNSLSKEINNRYDLLVKSKSRNIREYNEKFTNRYLDPQDGHHFLPYLVVILDEFGDLIMNYGNEMQGLLSTITGASRSVGVHLIIATSRPSNKIISANIKINFPERISFRVVSAEDSKIILDTVGANKLTVPGDMFLLKMGKLVRAQSAFVDTMEMERVSRFIESQQGYPSAHLLPEYTGEDDAKQSSIDLFDIDPLFEESARLIVAHQSGSTSLIQRKFSIGYNRTGRIMDQLELAGIVGQTQGCKPRDVYIQDEFRLEQIIRSFKQ
jgi:S-DNA-T family DNA segregation ATPase FtsK/SpoIIIE